jgi:hypothetical protein
MAILLFEMPIDVFFTLEVLVIDGFFLLEDSGAATLAGRSSACFPQERPVRTASAVRVRRPIYAWSREVPLWHNKFVVIWRTKFVVN